MLAIIRAVGDATHRGRGSEARSAQRSCGSSRRSATQHALPEESELLEGAAAGRGIDPVMLWAVNVFEELSLAVALPERCSTLSAITLDATVLGHEQWLSSSATTQAAGEHGNADGDEASVVLFSLVCELGRAQMWVAPGNPCETPFEEVDLGDVV